MFGPFGYDGVVLMKRLVAAGDLARTCCLKRTSGPKFQLGFEQMMVSSISESAASKLGSSPPSPPFEGAELDDGVAGVRFPVHHVLLAYKGPGFTRVWALSKVSAW